MKHYTTLLLKLGIIGVMIFIFTLSVLLGVKLIIDPFNPLYGSILYPIVLGLYLSSVPLYYALIQAFKLLNLIDQKEAFSEKAVEHIKKIKLSAAVDTGIYILILPFIYMLAQADDAPGLVIIGMAPAVGAFVIFLFTAVLQKLFQDAIDIKHENELTI